jgi:branched-chain amino acid transport system ATP-binding protein
MAQLELQDLHAYLAGAYIIQGVSLTVRAGETVVIFGQNGAGKTTLLRAIMGLLGPVSNGRVLWDGHEISSEPAWQRAPRGIGYVPQSRRIFSSLTVEENLKVSQVAGGGAGEKWTVADIFSLFPNLQRRRHIRSGLSGGEQQMLAIGRALMGAPKLILLDEPTEGLSPLMVSRVFEVLKTLRQRGYSILLVEQNFRLAQSIADEIHFMRSGRIVYSGRSMTESQIAVIAEAELGASRQILQPHAKNQTDATILRSTN